MSEFARRLRVRLTGLQTAPVWSLTPTQAREALLDLEAARAQLEGLRLTVLAHADRVDVAADPAATCTHAWLASATRAGQGQARADVTLATALDIERDRTRTALTAGEISLPHARVIVKAVAGIDPAAVTADPSFPGRAEALLVELAGEHDPRQLERLGRHILAVVDPDAADRALGEQLAREEAAAATRVWLEIRDEGDGTHSGRFRLPTLHTAMLTKALDAIMNPTRQRRPDPDVPGVTPTAVLVGEQAWSPDGSPDGPADGAADEGIKEWQRRARRPDPNAWARPSSSCWSG